MRRNIMYYNPRESLVRSEGEKQKTMTQTPKSSRTRKGVWPEGESVPYFGVLSVTLLYLVGEFPK